MFEPRTFLSLILFFFGAVFGSFANVVIYRLPLGESIAFPGSHCRNCKKAVRWYNNVPIFAWFWLRGRCPYCKTSFSFRYPFVELLMAVLFASAAHVIGWHWTLIEALIFIFGLVTVSFIDLDHMILPDVFTLPGIAIGLIGAALNPERQFLDALAGAAAGFGFLWAVAFIYHAFRGREGMGGGDIKLLAWIGAVLGWKAVPFTILVSTILGSVVGLVLALQSRNRPHDSSDAAAENTGMSLAIPFGPYLAAAALLYLLCGGDRLADWYLALHGL